MTAAHPPKHPSDPCGEDGGRPAKPAPSIEDVMGRPFLSIPHVAVLLGTSPDGIRKMMTLGTIVPPLGKRGRRWFWDRDALLAWMYGDDPGDWTPPPYRTSRPA